MNNQEKDHCLDRLMELDRKIADQVNYLFDHDSEIIAEQKENISNKAKLIFNKVSHLLEKHGKTDHTTLRLKKNNLFSIGIIKEEKEKEISMIIKDSKNYCSAIANLKKDELIIRYGMAKFNPVSETGGDRISHLVDLVEEEKLSEKV